jgi:hypothetical protein
MWGKCGVWGCGIRGWDLRCGQKSELLISHPSMRHEDFSSRLIVSDTEEHQNQICGLGPALRSGGQLTLDLHLISSLIIQWRVDVSPFKRQSLVVTASNTHALDMSSP